MKSGDLRKDLICVLVLGLLALAEWPGRLRGPIDFRWDAGVYVTLGTSIYEGRGFRLVNEPGEMRPIQYPPLLPAIIALHQKIAGTSDPLVTGQAMRWSWLILSVLYIPAIFWFAKRYVGRAWAVVVALLILLNPQSTLLSETCQAELPYSVVSLIFFTAARRRDRPGSAIAFVTAAAAYFLRTAGIALLAAWVLDAAHQRRFRSAAVRTVLAALPVFTWNLYIYSVEHSQEYRYPAYAYQRADYMFYNVSYATNLKLKEPFRPELGHAGIKDLMTRFLHDLPGTILSIGETVSAPHYAWHGELDWIEKGPSKSGVAVAIRAAEVALALLILFGMIRLFLLDPVIPVYVVLSLIIVASAPWPPMYIRYVAPLAPYLATALVLGLGMVSRVAPPGLAANLPRIAIGLVLLQQTAALCLCYRHWRMNVDILDRNGQPAHFRWFHYYEGSRSMDAAHDWILKETRPTDIIASSTPQWTFLRTGRKAVMVPFGDPPTAAKLLADVPARYFILDDVFPLSLSSAALPAIEGSPDWQEVFRVTPGCRIFARSRSGSAAAAARR